MSFLQYCRLGLHVSATDLQVVQAAQQKLKWPIAFKGKARSARKEYYRAMLREHREAKILFSSFRF